MMLLNADDAHDTHRKAYCNITWHSAQKQLQNKIVDYSDEEMASGVNTELKTGCKDRSTGLNVVQGVCTW